MKHCRNCGHTLPDFAKFCFVCGKEQLSIEEVDEIKEEPTTEEVQPEEPQKRVVDEETIKEESITEESQIEEPQEKEEDLEETAIKEEQPEEPEEKDETQKEEQSTVEEEPAKQEESIEEPADEEPSKEEVSKQPKEATDSPKEEQKKPQINGKFKKILDFLLTKDIIKYSLIFLGGLFVLSLLFWIIAAYTNVLFFFKFILVLLSLATAARMGYLMYKQIKENKFGDMFNFLLKGSITVMNVLLFVLNFILMVI